MDETGPLLTVDDYEARAVGRLSASAYDYYRGGADDETSVRRNRRVWERLLLRPRTLVDVGRCDLWTTVLGTPVAAPILVAPTAYHGLAHIEGEVATARGTEAAGSLMVVSTMSNFTLEDVAVGGNAPLWFQLYVFRERHISEDLVRRAEQSGYRALVLTVDVPVLGQRLSDRRNGFGLPPPLQAANFPDNLSHEPPGEKGVSSLATYADSYFDQTLTWEALRWLGSLSSLPIIVKGILTAEDAVLAVSHGAAGIIVSNHGGRQLDGAITSIEALPEIVAAVEGRCEVYLDGGIRRGTDVLKALALGARAVFVGRPVLWGLATDGADGVHQVLHLLQDELRRAMRLCGRPSIQDLDPSLVRFV